MKLPIACITGDVHHYLGGSMIKKQEQDFALKYLKSAKEYDVKTTLFVTGKSLEQYPKFWKDISKNYSVELGAHTYSAFRPRMLHTLFKLFLNSYYGPYFYQSLDIRKTLTAFKKIGLRPKSWRTHSYRGDNITYEILEKLGFRFVSDVITLGQSMVLKTGRLLHVTISAPPDDKIIKFYFEGKPEVMNLEGRRIKSFIFNLIAEKKNMTLQLHPLAMEILDEFKTFNDILKKLTINNYTFCTITEFAEKSQITDISHITRIARPKHISIY